MHDDRSDRSASYLRTDVVVAVCDIIQFDTGSHSIKWAMNFHQMLKLVDALFSMVENPFYSLQDGYLIYLKQENMNAFDNVTIVTKIFICGYFFKVLFYTTRWYWFLSI